MEATTCPHQFSSMLAITSTIAAFNGSLAFWSIWLFSLSIMFIMLNQLEGCYTFFSICHVPSRLGDHRSPQPPVRCCNFFPVTSLPPHVTTSMHTSSSGRWPIAFRCPMELETVPDFIIGGRSLSNVRYTQEYRQDSKIKWEEGAKLQEDRV